MLMNMYMYIYIYFYIFITIYVDGKSSLSASARTIMCASSIGSSSLSYSPPSLVHIRIIPWCNNESFPLNGPSIDTFYYIN